MANFNQTNINRDRFFFATKEEGEQDLFVSTISAAPLTDFYVGITGAGGNLVQINQMPDIIGTVTTGGEQMLYAGTASTYKTLSSLSLSATGSCISVDRTPGSGLTTIESYGTNGSIKGFEFLSRGVNSELLSTGNVAINTYMSSISRPGATAVFDNGGTTIMGATVASQHTALNSPPGGGGSGCYSIADLSGTSGTSSELRWSIGKFGSPTGGNVGSDFALFSYNDAGTYLGTPLTVRRSDGAMNIANLSSINGVAFDVSGIIPWDVYTVTNTGTQNVSLTAGVPQTVLTFSNIPQAASGVNAGGLMLSIPISVQNTSLTTQANMNLFAYFGGSTSGGSGVGAYLGMSSNLNGGTVTLSGVAIHNGSSNVVNITAVTDVAGTYSFTQGTSAFHKFFFQYVDG